MTNGTTAASFVYNENGLRVQKTVNGVVTDYTLHGKNIVHMKTGSDELHFFYDAKNKPAIVVYNGTAYSYVKNLQGDIVAILDSNGAVVVSYVYDAWGKPIATTGSMATTLGALNPFAYRSYVLDRETQFYHLRSRYYNSKCCRFVNADMLIICKLQLTNSYMYCANNGIVYSEHSGMSRVADWWNNTAMPWLSQTGEAIVAGLETAWDETVDFTVRFGNALAESFHAEIGWGPGIGGSLQLCSGLTVGAHAYHDSTTLGIKNGDRGAASDG